jgi:hypothetical protein
LRVRSRYFSSHPNIFRIDIYPGIRARSCHLAPTLSPESASLLWSIPSRQQVMLNLAMDGKREHRGVPRQRAPGHRPASFACNQVYSDSMLSV